MVEMIQTTISLSPNSQTWILYTTTPDNDDVIEINHALIITE